MPTTALQGNKESRPNPSGPFAHLPPCPSLNNIRFGPIWAPALAENQSEEPSGAAMPDPCLGSAGGTAEPLLLSAHQFPVLLVVTLVLPLPQSETPAQLSLSYSAFEFPLPLSSPLPDSPLPAS